MPQLIVLRPPGGDSGVRRRRYTAREKIAITAKIRRIKRETNCSYRQASASIVVTHTLVICWHAIRERFNNIDIKKLPCYTFIPLPYHGIGEVVHIPGGCTGLVQPLDVSYNKPFKTRIRPAWEEYMMNDMRVNGTIASPLREEVSHWISEAYWALEGSPIIKNVWLETSYSWF
jgi:hypothetical protein